MNLIDNGVKEVIKITPIIKPTEMYFLVEFVDWYGAKKERRFQDISDIDKKQWME